MSEWLRFGAEVAVTLLIPALIWFGRVLLRLDRTVSRLHETVYGVDGENGLRSQTRALDETTTDHARRLDLHDYRLAAIERGARGGER